MTRSDDWTAPTGPDRPDPAKQDRQRQELELRAKSPMRGRRPSDGLAGLPMFDGGLGL